MTTMETLTNGYSDDRLLSNLTTTLDDISSICVNGMSNELDRTLGLPPEECWLYVSRNQPSTTTTKTGVKTKISDWLHSIFDSADSPFCHSRYHLLTHLEFLAANGSVSTYRFGGSVPSLNYLMSGVQRPASAFPHPTITNGLATYRAIPNGLPSTGSSDSLSAVLHHHYPTDGSPLIRQSPFRSSATFRRVSRPKYSLPPHLSHSSLRLTTTNSNSNFHPSQSLANQSTRPWSGSAGKLGSFDTLDGIKSDVQEIARIQEDNLKADVAALVAAAAGRHGSQHSLGSLGRCTPDGNLSRRTSAPNSPNASHFQLNRLECSNESSAHIPNSNSLFDTSDLYDAGREDLYSTTEQIPTHTGDTVHSSIDSSLINTKRAYYVLPQKPTIPPTHIPYAGEANSFGFRPLRTSLPGSTSKPPIPSGLKRPSNVD